jgi:hypothetical protein
MALLLLGGNLRVPIQKSRLGIGLEYSKDAWARLWREIEPIVLTTVQAEVRGSGN